MKGKFVEEHELTQIGTTVSVNVMIAIALSLSARDHEDPRGALRDILSAAEEQLGDSIRKLTGQIAGEYLEAILGAAQGNALTIGKMADDLLRHMGVPPAKD